MHIRIDNKAALTMETARSFERLVHSQILHGAANQIIDIHRRENLKTFKMHTGLNVGLKVKKNKAVPLHAMKAPGGREEV
jgi:hypothetical protein